MGLEAGQSHEAAYLLSGPIKAGTWHLVGDGIIFDPCDVTYEVLWRGADESDHPIASFAHHFDPPAGADKYVAVPFDADAAGVKADAVGNVDRLILRISVTGTPPDTLLFIPNGDGAKTGGRIPSITAPR
jgi:hypothetical protein